MKVNRYERLALLCVLLITSCSTNKHLAKNNASTDLTHLNYTVEDASEWTNLFYRRSGWFGGDGIFALPQNGVDTASAETDNTIIFSDTMIGDIDDDTLKLGYMMIHNSVAILKGDEPKEENIYFNWDKKLNEKPESIFIPKTKSSRPEDYYWLGDGFVDHALNDNTYIFGYRIKDIKGVKRFGFEHVGSTFIIIPKGSKPPYKDQRQIDIPFFMQGDTAAEPTAFGSGILVNTNDAGMAHADGYVYVYGVREKNKALIAARVLPKDFEKFDKWRFWNGSEWVSDMKSVTNITDHVSNELSVSPLPDGRYALIFQVDGISPIIGMRLGSSPVGPFGPIINVYDCKNALVDKQIFPYNAKAHPSLSKPGELLISYNVNSFDFANDIKRYPNLYRPRFIKLKLF